MVKKLKETKVSEPAEKKQRKPKSSKTSESTAIERRLAIVLYLMSQSKPVATLQIENYIGSKWDPGDNPDAFKRAVQRDMQELLTFPFDQGKITVKKNGQANAYEWECAGYRDVLTTNQETAFLIALASKTIGHILPSSFNTKVEKYFEQIRRVLSAKKKQEGPYSQTLLDRIESVPRGFRLIPKSIDQSIWYKALQAVEGSYESTIEYTSVWTNKFKKYSIHPLGVIERGGYFYLVAKVLNCDKQDEFRNFNLVRIQKFSVSENVFPYPADFKLRDQFLSKVHSVKPQKFVVRFAQATAAHLLEVKISEDQRIKKEGETHFEITFTTFDTDELRWWLFGFGEGCEVIEPKELREYFASRFELARNNYQNKIQVDKRTA